MLLPCSQRPYTRARRTSQAARYDQAPRRSYSCSTRIGRACPVGSVAWQRRRAWTLVFSSAQTTQSRGESSVPCQRPSYKSSTREALRSKSGSRGKIQLRCDHGRIASSVSQRHSVLSPIEATIPRSMTSRRISGRLQRESGTSDWYGSSQARALTATTRLGGKERWAPGARSFLQARHAFPEEALAPFTDNLPRCVQARCDRVVVQALGCVQHDLG